MWPYANLSTLAKANGGPEMLIEKVFEKGRKFGRQEMFPVIGGALICGPLITLAVQKGIQIYKSSRDHAVKEAASTKKILSDKLKKKIASEDEKQNDKDREEAHGTV